MFVLVTVYAHFLEIGGEMRIAIIGGTGVIGLELVKRLKKDKHHIAVVHKNPTKDPTMQGVTEIIADIFSTRTFWKPLKEFKPDRIIHLIAKNSHLTNELIKHCASFCRRVVILSSYSVYAAHARMTKTEEGPIEPTPIKESDNLRKSFDNTYYTKLKQNSQKIENGSIELTQIDHIDQQHKEDYIGAEKVLINQSKVKCTIFRIAPVIGPQCKSHDLLPFITMMKNSSSIILNEKFAGWIFPTTYLDNFVAALAWSVPRKIKETVIYNMSCAQSISVLHLVQMIAQELKWQGQIGITTEKFEDDIGSIGDFKQDCHLDTSKLFKAGFKEPYDISESLRQTLKYEISLFDKKTCSEEIEKSKIKVVPKNTKFYDALTMTKV
ncbi:MAG: NAD(P)-dependent oxidoreductase [Parachlamydiales bacterium]|nr:NAD(P)-dependent oxidoreductase [Parachlamydiales bacterium]